VRIRGIVQTRKGFTPLLASPGRRYNGSPLLQQPLHVLQLMAVTCSSRDTMAAFTDCCPGPFGSPAFHFSPASLSLSLNLIWWFSHTTQAVKLLTVWSPGPYSIGSGLPRSHPEAVACPGPLPCPVVLAAKYGRPEALDALLQRPDDFGAWWGLEWAVRTNHQALDRAALCFA
jgi:hypothetical protein